MYNETRTEKAQRFSKIWWKSRNMAKKSQEYMSLGMGVSKKTIQNWEKGISSPSLFQFFDWFKLLGLNPMPYIFSYLYPDIDDNSIYSCEDKKTEEALIQLIKNCSSTEKKQLLYLMLSEHGSSWNSLLQMFTAFCHTTMQSRVTASRIIYDNYEIDLETGNLVCPEQILPDMKALEYAISETKNAAKNKVNGYF